jgi:hypothetical protein
MDMDRFSFDLLFESGVSNAGFPSLRVQFNCKVFLDSELISGIYGHYGAIVTAYRIGFILPMLHDYVCISMF